MVLLLFVMGLVWGSFLNVVIYRTAHDQSPLTGRSVCPKCKRVIGWKHNIPLLSFIFLKGKCVSCGEKISWQYPVVEFLTGVLFIWWYMVGRGFFLLTGGWGLIQPVFWLVIGMLLLVVLVADLGYGVIPDVINLALFSLILVYRLSLVGAGKMQLVDFVWAGAAAVGLTVFFGLLWWLTGRKGFGMGDVKLAPALGLLLGWPKVVVGMLLAFVIGSAVGLVLILLGKRKFGQTVPFGPFLVLGTALALIWGADWWTWYWGLM